MINQTFGVIAQYLVIFGGLIALFLILRNPTALSNIINSISNANVGAINAFKK